MAIKRVQVVDSHTGGEPTRVVVSGGPDLGSGTMAELRARFQSDHDDFRRAVVNEPRGSDVLVGALLCPPADPRCVTGVIFFNNVGTLHMCGHGTIGLAVTSRPPGPNCRESICWIRRSVVGRSIAVASRSRSRMCPAIDFANMCPRGRGTRTVHGDIAWGGNWPFLIGDHGQKLEYARVAELTHFTQRVRQALERDGIAGEMAALSITSSCSAHPKPDAQSRNFVLCPEAYDRSPCGTGTSAKLACLHAEGRLREGDVWIQESIVGSLFEGRVRIVEGRIIPHIRGSAYVNAEATLLLDPADPFQMGLRA